MVGVLCSDCAIKYGVICLVCTQMYIESSSRIDYRRSSTGGAGWICDRCFNIEPARLNHRNWTSIVHGSGRGKTVESARGWSVEIECYTTNRGKLAVEFNKLPSTFGINRDGSLKNVGNETRDNKVLAEGIEITTPILKGVEGEKYLKNLCAALNKEDNARVDLTCGTHLHIDMSDLRRDFTAIQKILAFHWIYETVLMSFLPSTRRANIYCQSLKNNYSIKRIQHTTTYDELYRLWYKNRNIDSRYNKKHTRYHGINMHSLFANGHIEVRYHSGTTNPKKILHWAALHTRIIDLCGGLTGKTVDVEKIISSGLTPLGRSRSLSVLTNQLFDLLALSEDTKKYLLQRQKKFKDMPKSTEVEFIEKDDPRIYEELEPEKESISAYAPSQTNGLTWTPRQPIRLDRAMFDNAFTYRTNFATSTGDSDEAELSELNDEEVL